MYYLFIDFKNAGFFRKPKTDSGIKDFYNKFGTHDSRKNLPWYNEPITHYQVSGMLHVLMGERPKPSLRPTVFNDVEYINFLAKNAYVKITTPYKYKDKNGNDQYFKEIIKTRKGVWDSNSRFAHHTWEKIKNYLGQILFDDFINTLKNVLNNPEPQKTPISDIFIELNNPIYRTNSELTDFCERAINAQRKPIAQLIEFYQKDDANCSVNRKSQTFINSGIDYITKISGKVIIPIDDSAYDAIIENQGFATLLDGGFVTIDEIRDDYMFNPNTDLIGYTKISEISTETI